MTSERDLVCLTLRGRRYGFVSTPSFIEMWDYAVTAGISNPALAMWMYMLDHYYPQSILDYTKDFI